MPEFTTRSRTSSDLKWLLNERAALMGAADELRKEAAHARGRLASAQSRVERIRVELAAIDVQQASSLNEVAAFDHVITSAYPQVRPQAAGSVLTWAGTYGKRGDLKKFVLELLRAAAPRALTTGEVLAAVMANFELRRTTTQKNKMRCNLRKLLVRGETVVEHLPTSRHRDSVSWRWRTMPTLNYALEAASHDCAPANALRVEVGRQRVGRSHG